MLHILKFGGSSVAYPERILNSVEIVRRRLGETKVAVVVSAFGGVTDELIAMMELTRKADPSWEARFDSLRARHYHTIDHLVNGDIHTGLHARITALLDELEQLYIKISAEKAIHPATKDQVLSYGERLSSQVFAAALTEKGIPAKAYESQHFVRTNDRFGDADVDYDTTRELVNKLVDARNGTVPVITGFIGSTSDQRITTLGRSGSDFTAGLMGQAMDANLVEIWTDVNGVLTADPNIASTAVTIPRLHYAEIAEMAHFGTKVLHPRTVLPLEVVDIPIAIYNSFEPDNTGTLITREYSQTSGSLKSVSLKKDIVLIGLKSLGLDRISHLLSRTMSTMLDAGIQVLFNSAASAEFGITFAINEADADKSVALLRETFAAEYAKGLIDEPQILDNVSMVTVIGDRLKHDLGLSGAVLSVLGENNIAPLSTAKGVANRHFSIILKREHAFTAVRLINDHFCVHSQRVRLFVAGTGTIGGALLQQLTEAVTEEYDLSVIGVCDKHTMIWNASGIRSEEAETLLKDSNQPTDWGIIINRLINDYPYRTVFVDCTGSIDVARYYNKLLKAGIHIATATKMANTFEQSYFDELMSYTLGKRTHYLYETTAGAGMPVFQTIKDLMRSGDEIHKISGVLSGTMTYLFEAIQHGESFGQAVRKAREVGYAEPDPRDDLSGEDTARKMLGIARSMGLRLERSDIIAENLTPEELRDVPLEEFFDRITQHDNTWATRAKTASDAGNVLRYVATLEHGKVRLEVQEVPKLSSLGAITGSDNLIAIHSKRYNRSPLVIQGPGAGGEVTAAGLLADIQKIAIRIVR